MKRVRYEMWMGFVLAGLSLGGCPFFDQMNDDDDDAPAKTDFVQFVKTQLAATAETTQPVEIDGVDFAFSEDPAAFDDVLVQE